MKSDFERWAEKQPRQENNKIDGRLLIEESKRRGYCVCPKPLREVIFFGGFTCAWCGQPETKASYDFYYLRTDVVG